MAAYRLHIETALGEEAKIIFRGDGLTKEDALRHFERQQALKTRDGLPYMPAGKVTNVELVGGAVDNPNAPLLQHMAVAVAPSRAEAEVHLDPRAVMLALAPRLHDATQEIVDQAAENIRQAISVHVEYMPHGVVIRSQPGEPPRMETGSLRLGVESEVAAEDDLPVGYVTIQRSGADGDEDAARVLEEGGLNGQGHYVAPRPMAAPEAERMREYAPEIVAHHLASSQRLLPLQKAIIAKWQEATAITTKGPWLDLAEDASTYPFGVYSFIGPGNCQQFFGNRQDEVVLVRFTIFGTATAAFTAQSNLHSRFDNIRLDLSGVGGGTNFHFVREGQSVRYEGVDANGVKVYRADSIYRTKTSLS